MTLHHEGMMDYERSQRVVSVDVCVRLYVNACVCCVGGQHDFFSLVQWSDVSLWPRCSQQEWTARPAKLLRFDKPGQMCQAPPA